MSDASQTRSSAIKPAALWRGADKAILITLAALAVLAFFDLNALAPVIASGFGSLAHTAPFILFAIFSVAYLKATGAEGLVAKAFTGPPVRMIIFAAIVGGVAPFCSCEVIPFVSALLALGAPLGAVMALWLASPLMDPAQFAITGSALGFDFAIAKTVAAISVGIGGGLVTQLLSGTAVFSDPLKIAPVKSCCSKSSGPSGFDQKPLWKFWGEADRTATFRETTLTNGAFLFKWLLIAYIFEAMMTRYVPAEFVAGFLGGEGVQPVILGAILGGPAYLNGYAAVPLVAGLVDQGMSQGAALSFMMAGGVSCIPAAIAVYALVKRKVFAAYLGLAFVGSVSAGLVWQAIA